MLSKRYVISITAILLLGGVGSYAVYKINAGTASKTEPQTSLEVPLGRVTRLTSNESDADIVNWRSFRDESSGFAFRYPDFWTVQTNPIKDGRQSFLIKGKQYGVLTINVGSEAIDELLSHTYPPYPQTSFVFKGCQAVLSPDSLPELMMYVRHHDQTFSFAETMFTTSDEKKLIVAILRSLAFVRGC